ncbi:MAG: LysM peptidoglycan-binding domain-containing protein, partial [Nitrospinae bacterium]|nr:LysM peptidoglycan-binding domain-containing protein [Nitrospinota bacterium]
MNQKIEVRSQKSEVRSQKVFLYLLYSVFCLSTVTLAEETPTLQEVIKRPKVHIVREGDTLWDISGKYLNDHFKWQNIRDSNKFIVNPDLIYPGDNIVIPELFDE